MSIIKGTIHQQNGNELLPKTSTDQLIPAISKTFASISYYATAGSWEASTWHIFKVIPNGRFTPWRVKFKVHSWCPAYANVDSLTYGEITGRNSGHAYQLFNERYDPAHYYMTIYPAQDAALIGGYGMCSIGISILYGTGYTSSAYYRNFQVDLYEYEGCTLEFFDAPQIWANSGPNFFGTKYKGIWKANTSYSVGDYVFYSNVYYYCKTANTDASWSSGKWQAVMNGVSSMNAVDRGLRETGDDNTTSQLNLYRNSRLADNLPLNRNSLVGFSTDGMIQPFSFAANSSTSIYTAESGTRIYNTRGFDIERGIKYYNSSTNRGVGATFAETFADGFAAFDFRYTDNCLYLSGVIPCTWLGLNYTGIDYTGTQYTGDCSVYIRGTIGGDGLFYLAPMSEPMVVPGYYYNGKFYTTTAHSAYVTLSTLYTYLDITSKKYYKCTSTGNNGVFSELDATGLATQPKYKKVWTQRLPTTNDGYYYWKIGAPYYSGTYPNNGYQLDLETNHPIFYHDGAKLRNYTPADSIIVNLTSGTIVEVN